MRMEPVITVNAGFFRYRVTSKLNNNGPVTKTRAKPVVVHGAMAAATAETLICRRPSPSRRKSTIAIVPTRTVSPTR